MIQECYEEAIPWLQQSLAILRVHVWSYQWRWCGANWRYVSSALALISNPSICYGQAEAVQQKAAAVANYQVALGNIGNVYLYRKEFPTSISYYQRALAIAREIRDPVSMRKWTYNTNLAYMRIRAAADQSTKPAA